MQTLMMNAFRSLFACSLLLATLFSSCVKESPDPLGITASFEVTEATYFGFAHNLQLYDTDSISTSAMKFTAKQSEAPGVHFSWQISGDSILHYGPWVISQTRGSNPCTVRLTVTRVDTADSRNNRTATSTRVVYPNRPTLAQGIFEGYFEGHAQKATLKIENNWLHPMAAALPDHYYRDSFRGLLITSTLPQFDTVYYPASENRYLFFNRKLVLAPVTTTHYDLYPFNRKVENLVGEVLVDVTTKKTTLHFKAKEVSTGKEITLKFSGQKAG